MNYTFDFKNTNYTTRPIIGEKFIATLSIQCLLEYVLEVYIHEMPLILLYLKVCFPHTYFVKMLPRFQKSSNIY